MVKSRTIKRKGMVDAQKAHLNPVKTSKLEQAINSVSGSKDYMNEMSQIIGNINTIQKEYYQHKIKRIKTMYGEIEQYLDTIRPLTNPASVEIIDSLKEHYIKLNLNQLYVKKVTKRSKDGKEKPKDIKEKINIRPKDIIESGWFKKMRDLEIKTAAIKQQFKIESPTMSEDTKEIIREDYNAVVTFKFLNLTIDAVINDITVAAIVYHINKHCNDIFNILYEPMYDYKKYIQTHWLSQIDTILSSNDKIKSQLTEKNRGPLTREEAQNYVGLFAKAKYRLGLLDNAADFTKVFFDVLGEADIANLDASRFMDIIGNLDVKEIDKTGKLQQTLELTKNNISKLGTDDFKFEDIVKDFEQIIKSGNDNKTEVNPDELAPVEVVQDTVF